MHLGPHLAVVAPDPFLLNQAMEALRAYSLVQRDGGNQTFTIHRLVQAVQRDGMNDREAQRWVTRAIRGIEAAPPVVDHQNWSQWNRLLPHALKDM